LSIPGAQEAENTRNGTLSNNGELPSVFPSDFSSDPRYGTAGRHYTHPEEAFYSTRSLQLNAGDPTTATSHIAHDERPPNTGAERLKNGPTTYAGAVYNVQLSNPTVLGTGAAEHERDGTFFKSDACPLLFPFTFSSNLRNDISGHQSTTSSIKIPIHSSTVTNRCPSAPAFFVDEHMLNTGTENIQSSSTTFMDRIRHAFVECHCPRCWGGRRLPRRHLSQQRYVPIHIPFNFVLICEMELQPVVLQVSTKFFMPHILHDLTLTR